MVALKQLALRQKNKEDPESRNAVVALKRSSKDTDFRSSKIKQERRGGIETDTQASR